MLSLVGTYLNGYLKLDKEYTTENPVKVIVTFLEEVQNNSEKELVLTDFSFQKQLLKKDVRNHEITKVEWGVQQIHPSLPRQKIK
jgi:hypothetical protein